MVWRSKAKWEALFTTMIAPGDLLALTRMNIIPRNRLQIPFDYDRIWIFQRGLNRTAIENALRIDGFPRAGATIKWSTSPINTRSELRFNQPIRIDIKFQINEANWDSYLRSGKLRYF